MNFSRHEGKTALFVLILITSKGTSDNENIFKLSVPTSLRFSVLNFLKNTFFPFSLCDTVTPYMDPFSPET